MTHGTRIGCVALLLALVVGCQGPGKKIEPANPVKPWNPASTKGTNVGRAAVGPNAPLMAGDGFPKGTARTSDPGPAPIPSPAPPQPATPEMKLPSASTAGSPPIVVPPEPVPPPGGLPPGPPTASGPISPPALPK